VLFLTAKSDRALNGNYREVNCGTDRTHGGTAIQAESFGKHIQGLSHEQAQKLLLKAVQQSMFKDNIIKCCICSYFISLSYESDLVIAQNG
jgi:hypothetical protein